MSDIVPYLFETNAIKFCPENQPFWLTSGKISPYFVNTHFVYGSEKESTEFLSFIDTLLSDRTNLPKKIFEKVLNQYNTNNIFKDVINTMIETIKNNISINEIDYISGGERRDWYFSNIIAYLLHKPHITIFKDLETFVSDYEFSNTQKISDLSGKKVLHVTDLVTIASSFVRSWIPAIRNLGGEFAWTCYVVDRKQGGTEIIEKEGIKTIYLASVDLPLFKKAHNMGIINDSVLELLDKFLNNPDETMKQFLIEHPEFIENSLNSDNEKTRKRAQTLIDENLYGLN